MTEAGSHTILDLIEFLGAFAARFTSYGISHELVQTSETDVTPKVVPAIKPHFFFRGQTAAYARLIPTLYRKYPNLSGLNCQPRLVLASKDGTGPLEFVNPHYDREFDREFLFSRLKCFEVATLIERQFPDFPREINAPAVCQHYGLPTPFLDFSENLTVAAFFATHRVIDGRWEPSRTGTGVIYLIRPLRDEDDLVFFEIGIQPLPRPFAQKGSLLYVEPGLNLLDHPAVRAFGFRHDEGCSRTVAKQLGGPQALFPDDKFGDLIEAHKLDTYVTRDSIERFLQDVPSEFKDDRRKELRELLGSSTEFRG